MASTNRTSIGSDRFLKMSNGSIRNADKNRGVKLSDQQMKNNGEPGKMDDNVNQDKMLDLKSKVLKKASSKVIRRDTWAGPADLKTKNDMKSQDKEKIPNTSGQKVKKKASLNGKVLHDAKIQKDKCKSPQKSDKAVEPSERNKTRCDLGSVRQSRLDLYESAKVSNNLAQVSSETKRESSEKNYNKEAIINSLVLENNIRKRENYKNHDIEAACEIHLNSIYNDVSSSENKLPIETKSDKAAFESDFKKSESKRKVKHDSCVNDLDESSKNIIKTIEKASHAEDPHSTEIYIDTQNGQVRVKSREQHLLTSISDLNSTKVLIQQKDVDKKVDGQRLPCSVVDDTQSTQEEIRDIFSLTELNTNMNRLDDGELKIHQTSVSPFALVKDCNSEVEFWLHGLGLPDVKKYVKIFADHEIDLLDLEFMTAAQLHDMGITALGALDKILKGVKDLRSDGKTKLSNSNQKSITANKQLSLSSIAWEEDGVTKLKPLAKKSIDYDSKEKESGKSVSRNSLEYRLHKAEAGSKTYDEEERSASAMSFYSDEGESVLSSRPKGTNRNPSFSASTKSSSAKCVDKRPPTSKSNIHLKGKTQKVIKKLDEKKNDLTMSEKAGFRLSQMEGKPTKSVLIRQRSSSLSRDSNPRQMKKEEKEAKGCNLGYEDKGRSRNLRYRSRSADAVKRKALEGVQTAAKRFEEKLQRDRDNKHTFNLADEKIKAKRDEMAARHLLREKNKELVVDQSSDTEEEVSQPALSAAHVQDESLESLVTVNILSQSGPARQQTKGTSGVHCDSGTVNKKVDVKKSLRRVEPARKNGSKLEIKPDHGVQIKTAKVSPIKTKSGHRDTDKSPRSQSEPESGYRTDGSTSYCHIEDRVTEIQGKIRRLKARAGSGDDLTGTLVQDLQAQLQQFQQILGTRNQAKNQGTIGINPKERLSDSSGNQSHRGLSRSSSFELPKVSPIEEVLAEDETMNKVIKDEKIGRMSKRELLDEMREEKKNHHLQIRQLQKELERIKHADPVTSMEIQQSEIIYKKEDLIGEGLFSQVFKGLFQGSEVAVKKLKVPLRSQDRNYFTAELSLLKELRHPRVVLLIGVCTTDKHPVMVLEYMSRGSLYHYLHDSNNESLDHALYFQVARDVTAGMKYLHSHRPEVIHLDLKSMNVLLCQSYRAKIADFGFSKLRHDAGVKSKTKTKQTNVSSPAWMSPELLNKGEVTTKTDVYSFGVILWEMLTRQEPYNNLGVFQILERVRKNKRPEIPVSAPDGLQLLISQCWDPNPAKRPQFKDILLLLENIEFPPAWRELFRKAGVPDEALSNVHSTRNIIKLVTDMLDLQTLPNFMLKAKTRTNLDGQRSSRSGRDIQADSDENHNKKEDAVKEADRDNWDIETVTTLSDGELSDESDVTIQDLKDSSADESIMSSESNDERSATSSDFASTVVSVDSKRIKKRPVNVFIPSLELSIESARKEFSAERDRISRSSWMSISLDDRTSSSLEQYSGRHGKNKEKNNQSETSLNLSSNESGRNSIQYSKTVDEKLNERNLNASRSSLSETSAKAVSDTGEQDYKIFKNNNTSYEASSDKSAKHLVLSFSSQEKDWNDKDGCRTSLNSNKSAKVMDQSDIADRTTVLHQLSNRSDGMSGSENRVPSLHQLSNRSDRRSGSENRAPSLHQLSYRSDEMSDSENKVTSLHQLSNRSDEMYDSENRITKLHKLSDRSDRSSSPSSVILNESNNLHSSARSRRRSRNNESPLGKSHEYQMRESFNNMRPPSPKKRVSITRKLMDSSVNSENDSARSEPLVQTDNNSSTQSVPFSANVDSSYDSFFGIQSTRNLGHKLQSSDSMKKRSDLNAELDANVMNSFKSSLDSLSFNVSCDNEMDKNLISVKSSQVHVVNDMPKMSSNEEAKNWADEMGKYGGKKKGVFSKSFDVPVDFETDKLNECVEEERHVRSNIVKDSKLINSSHSLDTGSINGDIENVRTVRYSQDKNKKLKNSSEIFVKPENDSQLLDESHLESFQNTSNLDTPRVISKVETVTIEDDSSFHFGLHVQRNRNTNTGMKEDEKCSIAGSSPTLHKQEDLNHNDKELTKDSHSVSKLVKSTETKHDGGEEIRVVRNPAVTEEKKKPAITPRKSKMKLTQDSQKLHDGGNLIMKSQTLESEMGLRLHGEGKRKESCDNSTKETQDNTNKPGQNSLSLDRPVRIDYQVTDLRQPDDSEKKSQKSTKIKVKLRKDPLAVKVTRDGPSSVPPAPPPPPPPVLNLSKSMSAFGKNVQADAPRLSIADELKHKISQRQSISEGIKIMRKDSGHAFKPIKSENVIGTSKQNHSNDMKNSSSQIENEVSSIVQVDDSLLVPQQSEGLPSFVLQSVELQDQKDHLRSISKPHPDQLDDLNGASQEKLPSIADILRKAVMGRRIAMREDGGSVSQSFDSVATGWSVDLT